MKLLLRSAAVAAGVTFLYCFEWAAPLVSPTHASVYHNSGAPASIFLPVLFNLILVWLLLVVLLSLAEKPGRLRVVVWSGLIMFTPWRLLKAVSTAGAWPLSHRWSVAVFLACGICWLAVVILFRPSHLPKFDRIQKLWHTIFIFAAPCSVLVAGELCCYFWAADSLQPSPLRHSAVARQEHSEQPRVIWIILDELSYQQVYERRFPGLELPAFDALASQATVFTHVVPAAGYTEAAIPSLMTGLPVDHIRADAEGSLRLLHNPVSGQWQTFDQRDTIFEDAVDAGYSTAVAGWYNPYCRILSAVLDHCQWSMRTRYWGGMRTDDALLSNVVAPWSHLFDRNLDSNYESAAEIHLADYLDISSAGDRFLQDPSVDFLLLHIPIPHPGGIYDRRKGVYATTHRSSYIDNLALADRYLGHVRQVLEQRGEWDSSAVVVMGDHSWRTHSLWVGSPVWTAEDDVASRGGQFDDRPGYIVKLPHQAAGARIDSRFAASETRALLDGILGGSIRSAAELKIFAEQPPAQPEGPAKRNFQAGQNLHERRGTS